jgi:hypothetical protein
MRATSCATTTDRRSCMSILRMGRAGQLHSSLNGGSLEQGRIDGLKEPAPLLDADKLLDAVPLVDVDTLGDP